MTIAANRCRTSLSKKSKRPYLAESLPDPAQPELPQLDLGEELERAVATLRDDYRMAFLLYHEQELSLIEISEIMDVGIGTIKTWLHRSRKELAEILRQRGFS